jgi:transposase InsO family protein
MAQVPKHDIHKFRDIRPKLGRDNWVSWKRELLATARDRGLYAIITGTDELPDDKNSTITVVSGVQHVGDVPLTEKVEQWHDRNNAAYNQILLCISPELQTATDGTDVAAKAWTILVGKFESKDPSKVSIVRTRYENYHMMDGQSVTSYLTTMKEFRSQLERMGEKIPDSTHAATILRNVPESWRSIAQTIRMISANVDEIEDKLEAHEADLNAVEISDQAATAFVARSAQPTHPSMRRPLAVNNPRFQSTIRNSPNPTLSTNQATPHRSAMAQRSSFTCSNCGKYGHLSSRCFAPGGGMEGQAPWNMQNKGDGPPRVENNRVRGAYIQPQAPTQPSGAVLSKGTDSTNTAESKQSNNQKQGHMVMMAHISDAIKEDPSKIIISTNMSAFSSIEPNLHYWFIDSAASSHICGNLDLFETIDDIPPITIETASGDAFRATKRGTIDITIRSDMSSGLKDIPITLMDVIYVPKLNANLLSVGRMTGAGVDVMFNKNHSTLSIDNIVFARGSKINNLFAYEAITSILPHEQAKSSIEPSEATIWHYRLAHTSYSTIEKMSNFKTVIGLPPKMSFDSTIQCSNCPHGKQTRAPFQKVEDLPTNIGDIVASDICGPFESSIGGYRYFVIWIDLKTRYVSIEFLKNKECKTVTESFKKYMAWLLRQKGAEVKRIRTDNGGEYMGKEFQHICGELGIIHETTSPYTPEHNGISERYNRMLQEGALTLRNDSGLSIRFWVSAIHTVNFVKNRLLHSRIGVSPHEAFWGQKPKIDWFRTYGSKCWALVPKAIRRKGDFRSIEGIFVGYFDNSKAYKIWIPRTHTVIKSRDVIFDEYNHIERVTIHSTDEEDLPNLWTTEISTHITPIHTPSHSPSSDIQWTEDHELPFTPQGVSTTMNNEAQEIERMDEPEIVEEQGSGDESIYAPQDFERGDWLDPTNISYGRGMRRPRALYAQISAFANGTYDLGSEHVYVTLANDEPSNFREAMNSMNAAEWKKACEIEYDTLIGYGTWTLVERPPDTNIVGNRWVFRVKRDNVGKINKLKARLVAQGFSQIPGIDFTETYSPTIRFTSIRFILALASHYDMELRQIDVKGAYLNGKLEELVYMRQPEGFVIEGKEDFVCKLNKGVYGLKQSGRVWYQTLRAELEKLGFKSGQADENVYFRRHEDGGIEIAGWYVDDGLLAANSKESMERMIKDISHSFEIQNLGEPVRLLGVKIDRNRSNGTIHISQPTFIDSIAKRFDIQPGRLISSPMDPTVDLRISTNSNESIDIPYASLIGCLNYCALSTRPDIAYATNKCAQFTSHPTIDHWEAAKRIVRYLIQTRDRGIMYKREGKGIEGYAHNLAGFTDADFAGDTNDRKSTTGWIFMFNNAPLSWASKKQTGVSRSSMEAELVAGSFTSAEGIWLIKLGKDFEHNFIPIPIFTDNQSFIMFANNDVNNNRTKHIDIHYHYTRDQISNGNIFLHYIPTHDNPADILTKPLSPRKHTHLLNILGLCAA